MVLAIDVIDRGGPIIEMRRHLQPMKTKVTLYFGLYDNKRHFTHPSSLTRRSTLVLKSGCVTWVVRISI